MCHLALRLTTLGGALHLARCAGRLTRRCWLALWEGTYFWKERRKDWKDQFTFRRSIGIKFQM